MPRLYLLVCLVLAATCASAQRGENQAASDADLVSSSELFYSESGGFAGRVHSARIEATGGTIAVRYRPREGRISDPPLQGTMPADVYLPLWRTVEALQPWTRQSRQAPAGGADMIAHELRIRIGSESKTLTWTEATPMRDAATVGAKVLAAAREYTLNR